uniref:Lipase n=1 Tax=Riptortus pedestris TaxID=329032 RepID=R4WDR6_RIPPE|nr:lipase [Riptortus pedestris]
MVLKLTIPAIVVIGFVGAFGVTCHEKKSKDSVPLLKRWAKFKNSKGAVELVNLYPDEEEEMTSNLNMDPSQVEFHLYTKLGPDNATRIYVNDSMGLHEAGFDPKRKTKFLVHGFLNNLNSDIIQNIKNNFLNETNEEYNIIAVDWSVYTVMYVNVDEKSETAGNVVAEFMDFIIGEGATADDIHCIGHSLGAHACGFAGNSVKNGKIGRITGLDPALPGFNTATPSQRLDATDAQYVDCIHTCGGFLGIDEPICTADFYPNAGRNQPGCHWFDFGSCSHGRSHELFAESILNEHLFPSFLCDDVEFTPEKCMFTGALMGYPANNETTGIFYTKTNDGFPFAPNLTNIEQLNAMF